MDEATSDIDVWILQFDDPVETALGSLRHMVEFLTLERPARDLDRPWRRSWIVRAAPLARHVVRFEV